MKKYFITLVLVVALATGVASAATLSATQISAIVSLLQAFGADSQTISSVHAALTGGTGGGDLSCPPRLSLNLYYGDTNSEVLALQNFLEQEGYLVFATGATRGIFDHITRASVDYFQVARGIREVDSRTGYVYLGPLTRSTILSYQCNNIPQPESAIDIISVQYSPAAPKVNEWITTSVTVKNITSSDYTKQFKVNVQGTTATINSLAAGAQTTVIVPRAFTFATAGTFTLNTAIIYPSPTDPSTGTTGDIFTNTLTFSSTDTTQPSLTVVSPNGGEQIVIGSTYVLRWQALNFPTGFPGGIYVELKPYVNGAATKIIQAEVIKDGYYYWQVPHSVIPGQYKIVVYKADQYGNIDLNVKDESNNYFTITSNPIPTSPLTISYPNGGQTWPIGMPQLIKWSYNRAPRYNEVVSIAVKQACDTGQSCPNAYTVANNITTDQTSYVWNVGNPLKETIPAGSYYMSVCLATLSTSQEECDLGDLPFKIVSGTTQPTVTVTYPNGGELLSASKGFTIWWKASDSQAFSSVQLLGDSSQSYCPQITWLKGEISNSTGSYYVDSANLARITNGNKCSFKAKVFSTKDSNIQDASDGYFTVIPDVISINKPPVITGLTAPSTLNAGQSGTWVVKAYDPEGGTLAYTINWGELQSLASKSSSVGQEASFTHSYAAAGTYKVSITVIDNAGQAAMTSATVTVGGTVSTPVPSINILSPSGGESWVIGSSQTIKWNSNNFVGDLGTVNLVLLNSSDSFAANIAGNITNTGSYSWQVPALTPGSYKISVSSNKNQTSIYAVGKSNLFNIIAPPPATAATITVTSPQPNEIWRRGNVKTIMWTTTNLGTDAYIAIRAINSAGQVIDLVRKTWNSGQVGWNVGLTADGTQLPAGFYRIRACITGPTGGCDKSSEKMLEIKEKSDGTSTGTTGAVGASSPNLWNWLGKVILGQ